MVTLITVAEIHRWRSMSEETPPESILLELVIDEPGEHVRADPSARGILQADDWRGEDGGALPAPLYWRHIIPELVNRFRERERFSPGVTLEDFCLECKANDREMNEVRAHLHQEDPSTAPL
jgi:hypothetical protein